MSLQTKLTKEYLNTELLTKGKNIPKLAKELNIHYTTLIKYCKKYNIYDQVKARRRSPTMHNLLGKKFNKLTVIALAPKNKSNYSMWECQCECEKIVIVRGRHIVGGQTKSCGGCTGNFVGFKTVKGAWLNTILRNAKTRNLEFKITAEDIYNQLVKQDYKCAITKLPIHFTKNKNHKTASIDRIDSSKGYLPDNIQIVHKIINVMKWTYSNEEFVSWAKLIYEENKDKAIFTTTELYDKYEYRD